MGLFLWGFCAWGFGEVSHATEWDRPVACRLGGGGLPGPGLAGGGRGGRVLLVVSLLKKATPSLP